MSTPNERSTAILDSLGHPVLAVDRNGKILFGNPAARLFWRLQLERLADFTIPMLFGKESPVWHHLQRAFKEESSFLIEPYRFDVEASDPLWLRVQIDPVTTQEKEVTMAVIAFWDLTHRENMETRERKSHLMNSLGLVSKRLAHELQNPLSGVKGAVQLLARKLHNHPELKEFPPIMQQELGRMERLVRDLLVQGDDQKLTLTTFNLHELLDTLIWFQKSTDGDQKFIRDYDPSLPEMTADRDKLHQVFLNLIQNAREAGGSKPITLRTRMSGPWNTRMDFPDPGKIYFQVEVEDQGPGVSEEAREHMFTPFFSTKKRGTGLGLSISYQIIRAHKGLLQQRNSTHGGAVFCAIIPLEQLED